MSLLLLNLVYVNQAEFQRLAIFYFQFLAFVVVRRRSEHFYRWSPDQARAFWSVAAG